MTDKTKCTLCKDGEYDDGQALVAILDLYMEGKKIEGRNCIRCIRLACKMLVDATV